MNSVPAYRFSELYCSSRCATDAAAVIVPGHYLG
jgi:hypothetical protein